MKYPLLAYFNPLRNCWEITDSNYRMVASRLTEADAQQIAATMNEANPVEVTVKG